MTGFLSSVAVLSAFLVSTYGWGRVSATYFYREAPRSPAFHVVLGLALWVFLGGLLNIARLAYPAALYVLFLGGLGLAAWSAYLAMRAGGGVAAVLAALRETVARPGVKTVFAGNAVPIAIVVIATAFLIATQLPTTMFNFHDDFHKYLVRPFRMMQTGSLAGGPFDQVGVDSVGSQSFLQSFVLVRFPIPYVNGFDPVFAFLIGGLLVNDIGRRAGAHWLFRALATLLFTFINPQYVNVSALYSGVSMILGLMYAGLLLADERDTPDIAVPLKAAIPFGLLTSSLIGLKVTFMPYAALYFAVFFLAFIFLTGDRRRAVGVGAASATTAVASLGPWMALSFNDYATILYRVVAKPMFTAKEEISDTALRPSGFENLFSTLRLYYGGNYYDYNFIVFSIAAVGLFCVVYLFLRRGGERNAELMVPLAACVAASVSYFVVAYMIVPALAIRYACPLLIGVLPASMLILGRVSLDPGTTPRQDAVRAPTLTTVLMVCQAIAIGLFADVVVKRVDLAQNSRTMLSFRFGKDYVDYTRNALGQTERERTRKAQFVTEEGETIVAWVAQPFHLDFARNEIFTMPNPDWAVRFRGIEFGISPEEFREHLAAFGIRYLMWEYESFGMRSDKSLREAMQSSVPYERTRGRNTLSLKKMLVALAKASKIIYNDGRTVVADIRK
jgi:hypothetical protein